MSLATNIKTTLKETHNAHIRSEKLFLRDSGWVRVIMLHYYLESLIPNGCITIMSNNFSTVIWILTVSIQCGYVTIVYMYFICCKLSLFFSKLFNVIKCLC